jgi:hypothetical protein
MNYCTCCGAKLNPAKSVWLELDLRIHEYHDFGGVPEDRSQGAFEFGPGCARKARNKADSALRALDFKAVPQHLTSP